VHSPPHIFERTVIVDHDMGMFEALFVGKLRGEARMYLLGGKAALFGQALDDRRL
jgi:hypothetical protein